jgi:hypothetical protein
MFITGAMVPHNAVCPHVVHTVQGTLHLLEDIGPSPILRCDHVTSKCLASSCKNEKASNEEVKIVAMQ